MEKLSWGARLANGVDLSGESIPGQPVVELLGSERVLIEEHRGVTEYSCQQISVGMGYGTIQIRGSNLELAKMTAHQMVITGSIDALVLIKGGKHGSQTNSFRHG